MRAALLVGALLAVATPALAQKAKSPSTRPSGNGLAVSDAAYAAKLRALNKKAATQPAQGQSVDAAELAARSVRSIESARADAKLAAIAITAADKEVEDIGDDLAVAQHELANLEDGRADKRYKLMRDRVLKLTKDKQSSMTRRSVAVNKSKKAAESIARVQGNVGVQQARAAWTPAPGEIDAYWAGFEKTYPGVDGRKIWDEAVQQAMQELGPKSSKLREFASGVFSEKVRSTLIDAARKPQSPAPEMEQSIVPPPGVFGV